jgi:Fur family peroxide stress response transcriptional regulator
MTKQERFLNALKQSGHRITDQRKAVCEYLAQTNDHPTPYQVYTGVAQIHPEISRATVYNTLNTLREVGAIVEIGVGGEHTHYETDTTPHINLICLRCHRVFDYQGDLNLVDLRAKIREDTGFESVTAKVEIMGFCSDCQALRREEIRQQSI